MEYFRNQSQISAKQQVHYIRFLLTTKTNKGIQKKLIAWNDNHQAALDELLLHLVTSPILAYPEYDQSFILQTDASHLELDCSLIQIQNGKLRVIVFGSCALVVAKKKKKHSSKSEFLALTLEVCEHF